jgi:DNA-binding response OmpR family regulator
LTAADRVLIVDDEPVTSTLYALVLESEGYAVTLCESCEEASVLLWQTGFDLVLLDLYFPGKGGGWEFLPLLRGRYDKKALPVIMLSAETHPNVRADLLARGANDFLTKPVAPATLAAAARTWIDTTRSLARSAGAA